MTEIKEVENNIWDNIVRLTKGTPDTRAQRISELSADNFYWQVGEVA